MSDLPRKTLALASSGHVYDYICIKPALPDKSFLLFLHGFPATAALWARQIRFFAHLGYGIIAPDLLGYGETSKPRDAQDYRSWIVVEDFLNILNHENVMQAHGIAHDAGTHVLSRLYNYYPERLRTLTFIAVPYTPPGGHFDADAVKKVMERTIGFDKLGYAQFLGSERAPELLRQHLNSFLTIAYHADADIRADHFYPPGKLEAWLQADRIGDALILDPDEKAALIKAFHKGDWHAATTGYRFMTQNLNEEREKADLAAGRLSAKLNVSVLAIDSLPDRTSLPGSMTAAMRAHIGEKGRLISRTVDSHGHYPHIVSSEEVNQSIQGLIETIDH